MENIRSSNNFILYQDLNTGKKQVFIYTNKEKNQMFQNLERFRESYEEAFFSSIIIYWKGKKVYYSVPYKQYLYSLSNNFCWEKVKEND